MNFFEHQKKARQHSFYLVVLFLLALFAIILIVSFFLMGFYTNINFKNVPLLAFYINPLPYMQSEVLIKIALGVVIFVASGSLYKYFSLSSGGKNVALGLGGKQLNYNSATLNERVLLNVVKEMSIASGVSVPAVYVLEEYGINAFVAGLTFDDMVIGVTRGTIEKLNRNELQGVIAHEFSHIFNGDMRLNLQLTALLHGILLIGLWGRSFLKSSLETLRKAGPYVIILGAGLFIIGYVGIFFGSLIKASVSRKREYLADATAVQYTRYPQGISGALKKIAYYSSRLQSPTAETYSHFYFAEGISSFWATHPPLHERIKKIEPWWNGKIPDYSKAKSSNQTKDNNEQKEAEKDKKQHILQGTIAATMMNVGELKEEAVEQAQIDIKSLDSKILERLNDPLGAQAVILSLFYDAMYKKELFEVLQKENRHLLLEFANVIRERHIALNEQSILIVSLGLNALKSLSVEQYQHFKTIIEIFINIDNKVSLFEWSLQYIIQRPLEIHLGLRKVPKSGYTHLGALKNELETLFSMLAQAQYDNEIEAKEAFDKTKKAIYAGAFQYLPREQINHNLFIKSIQAIEAAKPGIAERIFEGVLYIVNIDGDVSVDENIFVHAIAQLMQVPLPREFKL